MSFIFNCLFNQETFKVSEIAPSYYANLSLEIDEGNFKLYKDANKYHYAILQPAGHRKTFLIFIQHSYKKASKLFNQLSYKLQILVLCSNSVDLKYLQDICDTIREHPGYGCAHIIVSLQLPLRFSMESILDSLNTPDEKTGLTPLMLSIQSGNTRCMDEMLNLNADMKCVDKQGCNVFHYAVRKDDPKFIRILASKDSSMLNELNRNGESALHEACLNKKPKNVEALLSYKSDYMLTASGRYPMHCAVQVESYECLHILAKKIHDLNQMKQNPDLNQSEMKDFKGNTVMHIAKTKKMMETLRTMGCGTEDKNNKGQTPLLVKIEEGDYDACLFLLIAGANVKARDDDDNGALHYAIKMDRPEFVQMLLMFGADVNLCNAQQISPRHKAAGSVMPNKNTILYYLHGVGATRCVRKNLNCNEGCRQGGSYDGEVTSTPSTNNATIADQYGESRAMSAAINRTLSEEFDQLNSNINVPGDRILCLDGGGIRGLVSIQILMAIENISGRPIHELFDWIGGTSTGGILTVGLLQGKSLNYILRMYFKLKDQVFQGNRPYESAPLENFLKEEFGEHKKIGNYTKPKIMLTTVVSDRKPAALHIIKNYDIPGMEHDSMPSPFKQFKPIPKPRDHLIWKALRATTAAPTYFRASGRLIDGGIAANNPTLDVMTEIHNYNLAKRALNNSVATGSGMHVVVSVGTGRIPTKFVEHCDIKMPGNMHQLIESSKSVLNMMDLVINQATDSDGQSVKRSAAMCNLIDVPYFRFSPELSDDVQLDCVDDKLLMNMCWETQCYLHSHHEKLVQLSNLLV